MLIDFIEYQKQQFDKMAAQIVAHPEQYIDFDSVSDFYKAHWLSDFPQGTTWSASGLDDGAEYFYALIRYKNHYIKINVNEQIEVGCGISVL